MRIGIIAAMIEEIELLKHDMQLESCDQIASRQYYTGQLYGEDSVLVFSRWGKVASAMTATTLINHYKIDRLIFLGVAGAIQDELNIGDVVIARKLYQHDMDARPLFSKHEIPLTDTVFFVADEQLSSWAEQAAKDFCHQGFKTAISNEARQEFSLTAPACYSGIIASGDAFVSNIAQKDAIIADMPEVLAVEMEGAAVAQVCYEHNIPFSVIRIISDRADHSAPVDFPKFVAQVAKYYSRDILKVLYQNIMNTATLKA